jgi:hypothetical protein
MNCDEFNECSEILGRLENILINSGKISKVDLAKEQMIFYTKYNYLKTETDQDNYLADYHFYLMNKIEELGVDYVFKN